MSRRKGIEEGQNKQWEQKKRKKEYEWKKRKKFIRRIKKTNAKEEVEERIRLELLEEVVRRNNSKDIQIDRASMHQDQQRLGRIDSARLQLKT